MDDPVTKISRAELYDRIWTNTMKITAGEVGISLRDLRWLCFHYRIPTPSPGYWTKVHMGRAVTRTPLETVNPADEIIEIIGPRPKKMAEVIQSRGIQRTLQRESDKQYKFEIADAKRTERLLRKQIIEQRNFENDQIENAKRKAKFELLKQRELRIIVEIKQAFPLSEVAKNAGISKNRLELLVLSRTVGIFSPESVAAVFRPRMHGTLDEDGRYSCYSANAVTFAKAHDLSVWQKIAEQIEQAQEGDDPLEDIRCHLRGELTERERVRLFFYVPSKFWKINDPFRTLNGIFWLASNPDTPEEEFPDTFGDITSCREWLTKWKSKKIWQKIVLIQQQAKFQGFEAKWLSSQ